MPIQIGKIVAEFRKSKGLLQKDLARRAGMCAAQLCQIESGRVSPAFQMVKRLAAARHVPLACSVALSRAGAGLDGAGSDNK